MESKRVLLILADGCEDIETISQIDVLTRGGIPLTIASANGKNSGLFNYLISYKIYSPRSHC